MTIPILAVDDDHAVRISLSVMFRKWSDLELAIAESAEDALVMLKEAKYMMMLCDVDMPGMDGLELLEHVGHEYPEMHVVMLTGNHDVSTPVRAFRMGAMDYLQKPMQTADVRQVIDRAMELMERQTDVKEGIIDIDELMSMVKTISSEKMGFDKVGASSAKFRKIIEVMNEKLINPAKHGNIHNIFLLSKAGIVISAVTTKVAADDKDTDIMGSMFNALKEFMQDAVSSSSSDALDDIQFGDFHIRFSTGAYCDLAVIYTGNLSLKAEDTMTDSLIAFELSNTAALENWNGDMDELPTAQETLDNLFSKLDQERSDG
tara:strand:- start:669 stop:1622 length:954 start_codon:yes stop_codon:yes gene_type:complete